jgi:hypothetical protein
LGSVLHVGQRRSLAAYKLITSAPQHVWLLASGCWFLNSPLTLLIFYLFCAADSGGLPHLNADNFVVVNFANSMA